MKLEEMKYFVEIVKAGSINQASKTLYIAQPALSRTIASLERELGFPLLERSKHGVAPTAEGKTVYEDCLNMLESYNNCERRWETLAYHKQENAEPVTIQIVALPMICNSTMNQVMLEMATNYPRIRLKLFERQLQSVLETAVSTPHSIAISHYNKKTKSTVYAFAKDHDMQVLPLFDDEYRLFASKDNPLLQNPSISKKDLKKYTIASYSDDNLIQNPCFINAGLTDHLEIIDNVLYLSNRYDMMQLAAKNSQILTISAFYMTQTDPFRESNQLVALPANLYAIPMTYYILFPERPTLEEHLTVRTLQTYFKALASTSLNPNNL